MKDEKIFIDTNILVYAFDSNSGKKQLRAKQIMQQCFSGEIEAYVSNQILAELTNVLINKITNPLPEDEVKGIISEINGINNWKKINYSNKTLENIFQEKGKHFWDRVIAATMKEHAIFTIYTENISDFKEMNGINALNPL